MDISRATLARIASADPDLAARLLIQGLPSVAVDVCCEVTLAGGFTQRLGVGSPSFHVTTDPRGLLALWAGESPVPLMLRGRVRVRGKRRHVAGLRALATADHVSLATDDVDALVRLLPWVIEPAWTRGHEFRVGLAIGAREWTIEVREGLRLVGGGVADTTIEMDALDAARPHIVGAVLPAVLLGRWIERARGGDVAELAREERQRVIQASRADAWTEASTDPLQALHARAERERWSASDIDLAADRAQWVLLPQPIQTRIAAALAPVAAATERLSAGLHALLPAAPTGEHELVLVTHLADLGRQVTFLDRYAGEVLALEGGALWSRLRELRRDDGDAREIASLIASAGDPWADGVAVWHRGAVGEAAELRRRLRERLEHASLLPGLVSALALSDRDGERHAAFGAHVLHQARKRRPANRETVRRLAEMARAPA